MSALAVTLFVLMLGAGPGQSAPPAAGLAAEGESRWTEALQIYREHVRQDPGDAALWTRIAEIETKLGRPQLAVAALESAAAAAPSIRRPLPASPRLAPPRAMHSRPFARLKQRCAGPDLRHVSPRSRNARDLGRTLRGCSRQLSPAQTGAPDRARIDPGACSCVCVERRFRPGRPGVSRIRRRTGHRARGPDRARTCRVLARKLRRGSCGAEPV